MAEDGFNYSACFGASISSIINYFVDVELTPKEKAVELINLINSSSASSAASKQLKKEYREHHDAQSRENKLEALEELLKLSRVRENQEMLCTDPTVGLVPVLVRVIKSTTNKSKARNVACAIIWNLAAHNNNKTLLANTHTDPAFPDYAVVQALVDVLDEDNGAEQSTSGRGPAHSADTRTKACGALRNLATHPDNRHVLVAPHVKLVAALMRVIEGKLCSSIIADLAVS
jgi:hypothetical protein